MPVDEDPNHVIYNGHEISVDLVEVKPGRSRWSYTIDGAHYKEMEDVPRLSEVLARQEAIEHAKARIDGWS